MFICAAKFLHEKNEEHVGWQACNRAAGVHRRHAIIEFVMLQATRLRSQYPERQQHQQQRRHKASAGGSRYCCRPGPKLFLLFAALGSAIGDRTGGGGGSSSHRSPPPPSPSAFFFGRGSGSSSRDSAPPVPETLSLGDKLRSFGDRFRRDGGADGLEGGGGSRISSKRSGSSSSSSSSSRKAMAEGGAKGRDDGVAEGAANGQRKSNGGNSFIAGGLAGSISTTVTCPIEVRCFPCYCRASSFYYYARNKHTISNTSDVSSTG